MITDHKKRPLKWVFKNVYQPANPDALLEREMNLVAAAVDEFCVFAGGNPAVSKIEEKDLAAFRLYLKAKGFASEYCYRRRYRVQRVIRYVLPPPSSVIDDAPSDGSLRQFVGDRERMKIIAGNEADVDRYAKDVGIAVRKLCRFVGRDVKVAEITPELISDLEESLQGTSRAKAAARLLRRTMRTVDPVRFRYRSGHEGRANQPCPSCDNQSTYFLDNLFREQFEPRRLRAARPNTKRIYGHALRTFAQFLERPTTIDDFADDTFDRFVISLRERKVAPRSINRHLGCLLCFWRWCCDQNMVEKRPDVQLERVPREVPVAWTEAEVQLILQALRQQKGYIGSHRARDWWAALLQIVFCTGERIGAVMKLEWLNVDLERQTVIFVADDRKGGVEPNPVRLSDEAVEALRRIQADGGVVFPWPQHPTYMWTKFKNIVRSAGLPCDRWRMFHCIRKTTASHIEAAGGNATQALRHSDRRVTEAYLDPRITKPQQPVDLLFKLTEPALAGE